MNVTIQVYEIMHEQRWYGIRSGRVQYWERVIALIKECMWYKYNNKGYGRRKVISKGKSEGIVLKREGSNNRMLFFLSWALFEPEA